MEQFSVLHITDLHFGQKSDYEKGSDIDDSSLRVSFTQEFANNWQSMFVDELKNWIAKGNNIDYVAFTGDLGLSSGSATQEEREKRMELGIFFLKDLCIKLGFDLERLIICPGNHDLDRNNVSDQYCQLKSICCKHSIKNVSTDGLLKITVSDGVQLYSINSCLGGTEKSTYLIQKSSELDPISKKDFDAIDNVIMKQFIEEKGLDIPAIGDTQTKELCLSISKDVKDTCILLMHHNPIPTANIDIRPYANVVDAGRLLNGMLNTGKNVFILHGHTHFESCITTCIPDPKKKNYISIIGGAPLNNTNSAKANILQFFFFKKQHVKTDVFEVKRASALFTTDLKTSIYNNSKGPKLGIRWDKMVNDVHYKMNELTSILNLHEDELIMQLLLAKFKEDIDYISNKSADYRDWEFIKKG